MRIGHAHIQLRPYGFASSFWEKLGETIIDVVLGQEAVRLVPPSSYTNKWRGFPYFPPPSCRDLPGASQAWVILTACIVDQLRAGYENPRDLAHQRSSPQQKASHV